MRRYLAVSRIGPFYVHHIGNQRIIFWCVGLQKAFRANVLFFRYMETVIREYNINANGTFPYMWPNKQMKRNESYIGH